jgi:hypothetical protein
MAISFVADAAWSSGSGASSFTLTKPTGTTQGDFMVAIVALDTFNTSGGDTTVTPPSGWSSVGHRHRSGSNLVIDVMTRTVGSSDPASWSGTLNQSESPRMSIVATYRGASGIAIDGTSDTGETTSFSTATINNPTNDNWRIVCAAYTSATTGTDMTSNEVTLRERRKQDTLEAIIYDSNGTISTGNTSRTVSRGLIWESAASWIGAIDASSAAATNANAETRTVSTTTNQPRGGVGVKAQVIG